MKTPRTIKKICTVMLLFALVLTSFVFPMQKVQARTITSNDMGTHGGYDYEFWRDSGTGTMVLKDGEHLVVNGVISITYYFVKVVNLMKLRHISKLEI